MKIKLVIWDLDNTLWQGILDEGDVVPNHKRLRIIRELNERGVVSSICSKNDIDKATAKLREISLFDEIIFPVISWLPKGPMVKSIVEAFQLRAENVLFVDDEKSNLNEVLFHNPKINVLDSKSSEADAVLRRIMADNKQEGRNRFRQYKSLEKKKSIRTQYNDDKLFLRESEITIWLDHKCMLFADRIEELINRTNQLNFTKRRLTKDELEQVLNGGNENFVVFAQDKFGDYGLIGFVSFNRGAVDLEHFVFSCRVLNMGIENYIYERLGYPSIKIVGDVSAKLIRNSHVDWITEGKPAESKALQYNDKHMRILIAGGCDLFQVYHLLKSRARVDTYFNYPSKQYGAELHRDSLIYLHGSRHYTKYQQDLITANFPFVEPEFFTFPSLNNYDLVIYSPLIDYLQTLYAFREDPRIVISWGNFTNPTGTFYDEKDFLKSVGFNDAQITNLSSKWIPLGPISPEEFLQKLHAVFDGYSGKMILLGGATKFVPEGQHKYLDQHVRLNEALRTFQRNRPETTFVDVDEFLSGPDDFSSSIRHYRKAVHSRLAQYIIDNVDEFRKKGKVEAALEDIMERLSHVLHRLR